MPIDCLKCGEPNSSRLRVCRSCGANLYADVPPVQSSCTECLDKNPAHRQAHWMDFGDGLASHLQAEFSSYYQRNRSELAHKLAEISDYRARYFQRFADDSGRWLSPGQAYLKRMQACDPIVGMAIGHQPKQGKAAA